ncbi:MAG: integration host factor subunit beta [Candidatus Dadabacteria bacterium]|nr:MAG: integration host factor subunit beta [Candidatus Dadabacteria bacterium]
MNKSDLIKALSERGGMPLKEARAAVDTFFEAMEDAILNENRIEIRGFGSFCVKKYDAYVGRNPKTGERIEVPPKRLPYFKVGKELKERIDS